MPSSTPCGLRSAPEDHPGVGITASAAQWHALPVTEPHPSTQRDHADIQAAIGCFFDAFTSGPGVDARLTDLRAVLLPEARIVRTCGLPPVSYDVDSFIEPRRAMLTDGTLTDFHEEPLEGRLDVFGDIAQWFGRYTKQGLLNGQPYSGGGAKSIQLVRTEAGWRISAVVWDDDRADGRDDDLHRSRHDGRR